MTPPRFLVGIDLGTTNSVVAAIDLATREAHLLPRVVPIPQVTVPGEVHADAALPSFLYLPTPDERASGRFGTPWDRHPALVAGAFARDQGALQPARQVSSAKSWLSHPTADRTARILPWGADEPSLSPVEASARILRHLRDAWNHEVAKGDAAAALERQSVVLTVPASFDQEARELTVEAARDAGLTALTLIEEPLAAFYAFLAGAGPLRVRGAAASGRQAIGESFQDGEEVLVCDVGGGTTDFTTIRVSMEEDEIRFERTAVGEHLLLGGDNLDLALARRIEARLGDRALSLVQKLALRRTVAASKERLLSHPSLDRLPVTILGSGRAIVGASVTSELTRDEVVSTLAEGFLPMAALDERPHAERRTGLLEMGLPFAADPAITRHLAAFLANAARSAGEDEPRRPDAVLFNGGFFAPALARDRIVDALARWFAPDGSWRPRVLGNPNPASAVAIGAAHYALVRERGGLRVRAGSARAYYLGLSGGGPTAESGAAICVLPRGAEEGSTFEVAREGLTVTTNRPVSFPLSSSALRNDRPGDLLTLPEDEIHRHAPLATVLRYGKRSRQVELEVALSASYTETGTLEVSCTSRTSEHRWRLRFQLRGERDWEAPPEEGPEAESVVAPGSLEAARELLRAVFAPRPAESGEVTPTARVTPETLPARLEAALGYGRLAWETPLARALADTLIELADGRRLGPRYEARWLNLLGFCLRPGFGAPADDWRIGRVRGVYVEGLLFPNDPQCQSEWAVLWQRVAGGLKAGQQRELHLRYATLVGLRERKTRRVNPQVQREAWRLLASLEHLPARDRAVLGDALVGRLDRDRDNASYLWAIGRLGARVPAYGPLSAVVPPERAAPWLERLMAAPVLTPERAAAIVQIGARTDDPLRDLSDDLRELAARRLAEAGFSEEAEPLLTPQPAAARSALQIFGESLPPGLKVLTPPA
ncbi:MAG TPA: Hsp70 family protein [Vicinamibacterales bacterium]|nr:Hsp70 family protein [Acidobacteriota bacterium]HOC18305.1 Hsp70 family protein [Vicinamibacterales bacterium]